MDQANGFTLMFDFFARNGEVNRLTLDALNDDLLGFEDESGGFSIGQHLADMLSVRYDRLEQVSPAHSKAIDDPTVPDSPTWLRADTVAGVRADFDACDAAVVAAVRDAIREGRAFEPWYASHPAALLQHCIVHDAHHRGQIAALVRRSGRSRDERDALEDRSWALWRA